MKVEDLPGNRIRVEKLEDGGNIKVKDAIVISMISGEVANNENDEEDEDSIEQNLTDSISLLEDAYNTMAMILDKKKYPSVYRMMSKYPYLMDEFRKISEEILVFTSQYVDV